MVDLQVYYKALLNIFQERTPCFEALPFQCAVLWECPGTAGIQLCYCVANLGYIFLLLVQEAAREYTSQRFICFRPSMRATIELHTGMGGTIITISLPTITYYAIAKITFTINTITIIIIIIILIAVKTTTIANGRRRLHRHRGRAS